MPTGVVAKFHTLLKLSTKTVTYNPSDFISTETVSSCLRVGKWLDSTAFWERRRRRNNSVPKIQLDGTVVRLAQMQKWPVTLESRAANSHGGVCQTRVTFRH